MLGALIKYDVTTLVLCFVVALVKFVRRYNQVCVGGGDQGGGWQEVAGEREGGDGAAY